jgi:spermidine synthase
MIANKDNSSRLTLLFKVVFFFSGFSSLIYQVAWERILTLYYGVGAISMTLIVSIFMFGLGLGAIAGGYLAERISNKIRLFSAVQFLTGSFGFISLYFINFLGKATAGASYVLTASYEFIILCFPTLLMGMTLPVLTKIYNRIVGNYVRTVSVLYFVNTLGAAVGAIFATYVAISLWGIDVAINIAATLNFIIAFLFWSIRGSPREEGERRQDRTEVPLKPLSEKAPSLILNYGLILIAGFLAIGYELIWFRFIGVLVKHSPYAFSTTLAIYLLGIAIGSYLMGRWLAQRPHLQQRKVFFILQFCIALSVALIFLGYFYLNKHAAFAVWTNLSFVSDVHPPRHFDDVKYTLTDLTSQFGPFWGGWFFLFYLFDVLIWPMIFVFIPTIFMGAVFPVIASLGFRQQQEGWSVGSIYFVNIIGNVLGGLMTGFFLLPVLGTERTLLLFIVVGLLLRFGTYIGEKNNALKRMAIETILGYVLVVMIFFPRKGELYAVTHQSLPKLESTYFEEGWDSVILTKSEGSVVLNYINGQSHGGRPATQFYLQIFEAVGYLPKIENALVIGFGTGSSTEGVLANKELQKVTVVELSPSLIKNLKKIPAVSQILSDPRVDLVIDDGRRFLLRSDAQYDLVVMTPLRLTTAYSGNLYSKQFFALVKNRMKENGILSIWMDESGVMMKTLTAVFKNVQLYYCDAAGQGFALASEQSFQQKIQSRMFNFLLNFTPEVRTNILDLVQNYLIYFPGSLGTYYETYPINQDWRPFSEYYLGLFSRERRTYP